MKNIVKLLIIIACVKTASAQQIPLTSQYMFNPYLLNPAVAGSEDQVVAALSVRSQWTGLDGAPRTQFFSMHTKFGEKMGVGGYVFNDELGPETTRGVQLSYAYHLTVSDDAKVSFSLAGMLFFHDLNKAYLKPEETNDEALYAMKINSVSPDINFGVMYYTEKLKVGISAPQLLQMNMYGKLADANNVNKLTRHIYFYGEYKFAAGDKFEIVPSTLFKYVQGSPVQFDINARGVYDKKYWLGASYRYNNAIVGMVGMNYKALSFGYSYDYTSTDLKNYSSGGHEIFISAKLFEKEAKAENVKFQ
ncbi:MAG: type IX secretion system membrane protein PorP/SprF [Flavobacteriales bacterium]|nr:type IX secretion system membrane protein PorP/SprF [Flavobacteriales bacterium]